jgi:hypothetical protein
VASLILNKSLEINSWPAWPAYFRVAGGDTPALILHFSLLTQLPGEAFTGFQFVKISAIRVTQMPSNQKSQI